MKKKALVIGINQYEDAAHINRLRYAEQDAAGMRYFLQRRCRFEVTPLIGPEATRRRISDAVYELGQGLDEDDLFVFYFAGHGHEDHRGHLLLAHDVRYRELQAGMAPDAIPVRGLEKMTAGFKSSRALILDACRSPLEKGRAGAAALEEAVTRNLSAVTRESAGNPQLAVLCSCSPEQRAHELDPLKAGAFTEALISVLEDRVAANGSFALPRDLDTLTQSTNAILRRHGIQDPQDPWCTANRGSLILLGAVAQVSTSTRPSPPPAPAVPPSPPNILWHVSADGRPSPGMSLPDLKSEIEAGRVARGTLVWSAELGVWTPAGQVPAFADCFGAVEIPDPPPVVEPPTPPKPKRREPQAGDVKTFDLGKGVDLEMAWCPPGEFMMGSPELGRERPQHKVTLQNGFWLGKYPVTQAQWQAVTGENPSCFSSKSDSPQRPVEEVSWKDCQSFVKKLAKATGKQFRLPSEAEWEYACRAGSREPRYGDPDDIAWYDDNSGAETHPVGEKEPNAWGLHDMLGNVDEWCEDKWHGDYENAPTNGSAWTSGGTSLRVLRGGSWYFIAGYCRAAYRCRYVPDCRDYDLGLRLALSPAAY